MAKKKPYIPPTPTSEIDPEDLQEMIDSGAFRLFEVDGIQFISSRRNHRPPTIGKKYLGKVKADALPRATYSIETSGPYKGQKLPLIAWPYSKMTLQDFDDLEDAPTDLEDFDDVFAYTWTERGLHIYQNGKKQLDPGADRDYERISKEDRGWYGDRVRSRDQTKQRVLVTNDEGAATAFALSGGKVRLVNDIKKSYLASVTKRNLRMLKNLGRTKK